MPHRVNVVLKDEIWDALQGVPKGERSALVNDALARWIELRDRRAAAAELDRLSSTLSPAPGSSEEWIREDRESH
jgi:hypothetical protein